MTQRDDVKVVVFTYDRWATYVLSRSGKQKGSTHHRAKGEPSSSDSRCMTTFAGSGTALTLPTRHTNTSRWRCYLMAETSMVMSFTEPIQPFTCQQPTPTPHKMLNSPSPLAPESRRGRPGNTPRRFSAHHWPQNRAGSVPETRPDAFPHGGKERPVGHPWTRIHAGISARIIGGPFGAGGRGRSHARRRFQSHETWKTKMIPYSQPARPATSAPESPQNRPRIAQRASPYKNHPPKPGRLKTHPRARRRTA